MIPNSVVTIEPSAFHTCYAFDGDLILGNSVSTIGAWAFNSCDGLKGVLNIPGNVASIGDWAFRKCSNIVEAVSLAATPATLGDELGGMVFDEFGVQTLTVPCGCIEAYQNSAWYDPYGLVGLYEFIEDCTAVSEVDAVVASVYPNLTCGRVRIEAENLQNVSIFNLLGEKVFVSPAHGDAFEYDFGHFGTGLYLIKVETVTGTKTINVIVR